MQVDLANLGTFRRTESVPRAVRRWIYGVLRRRDPVIDRWVTFAMIVLALLLGFLDYVTGPLYSLDIFYLFPVALVAWYRGRRVAGFMCAFSAAIWLLADVSTIQERLTLFVNAWNVGVRLGLFAIASYASASIRETLERESDIAREIQRGFLPATIPEVPGLAIAASWQPALDVSGDYYDVVADDDRLTLCVADVTGKGMAAALLMANFQAAFHAFLRERTPPEVLSARVNRFACGNLPDSRFITFFVATIELASRRLRFCNAGHNPPLLLRRGGALERMREGGTALGLFPDSSFAGGQTVLAPGDRIVLFTDGLTEAVDRRGQEYGEPRLIAAASAAASLEAQGLARGILDDLDRFARGEHPDDVTLLVVSVD